MTGPRDIRSPLPTGGRIPRIGKLRLGVRKESSKNGKLVSFPSAVDYFVVNEDGATSSQAAESFHEVYGDHPREVSITIPGAHVDDVVESAWRQYGTGGLLKRKCSGPGDPLASPGLCVERGPAGVWVAGPCACRREGLSPDDKKRHCQERHTLTIMLMDVRGVGVWSLDTGSRMAAEGWVATLSLIESFRGHLQGAKAVLRVVPRQVSPGGVAKTVWISELSSADLTPAQALELGASTPQRVELPPSTLDDGPDDLIDGEVNETSFPDTAGWVAPGPRPDDDKHPEQIAHEAKTNDPLAPSISAQIKAMTKMHQAEFYRVAGIAKGTPGEQVTTMVMRTWERVGMSTHVPIDVPTLLQVLLDIERQKAKEPDSKEAFDHLAKTGEDVNPGDQMEVKV